MSAPVVTTHTAPAPSGRPRTRAARGLAVAALLTGATTTSLLHTATPASAASATCAVAPVSINTATDAQLATVPGVGKKMIKEIKEYRPYANFAKLEQKLTKYFPLKSVKAVEPCLLLK